LAAPKSDSEMRDGDILSFAAAVTHYRVPASRLRQLYGSDGKRIGDAARQLSIYGQRSAH